MKEIYVSISALILSVIAIIISIYFNRKSLQQAEKLVYAQLTYDDMKKVLEKVLTICRNEKDLSKIEKKVRNILYSYKGALLPKEFRKYMYEKLSDISKHRENAPWYQESRPMTKEEEKEQERYYAEKEKSLDPILRYDRDEKKLMNNIKKGVENKISDVLSKLQKR